MAGLPAGLPLALAAPATDPALTLQITRPPLGLSVNVTDASGASTRWSSEDRNPENRPRNIACGSRLMHGFAIANCDLSRRGDRDYVDAHLVDALDIIGADGSTVWEGRIGSMARSIGAQSTVSIQSVGWMSHAQDREFTEIFVDRDTGQWGDMPQERKAQALAAPVSLGDFSYGASTGGLTVTLPNQPIGAAADAEAWYQAPSGCKIAKVGYRGKTTTLPGGWLQTFYGSATRAAATPAAAAATLDDTLRTVTLTAAERYVLHQVFANGIAATPAAGSSVQFSKLAAYGDHGVTLVTGDPTEPQGVTASSVIRYLIGRYCPMLNANGVLATSFVIPHLVFRDLTSPYDAFLAVNAYHLWDLSVWEGRTAHFTPTDLRDYDWDIRTDDPGFSTSLQGDDIQDLKNGIVVSFTDVLTGAREVLSPADHPELRDDSVENPFNAHGYPSWKSYDIGVPLLVDSALQIGRAALAEFNAPKAPGSITTGPYVRDRAGHWQPAWRVRSGDRIAITSSTSLSDRPRVIHEVSYSHGPNGVGSATIAVDSTFKTLPAVLDRLSSALTAAGLG